MRRFFLLFSLISLCSGGILAQRDTFKGEFYLGIGGGANTSNVDFIPHVAQTFHLGAQGGIAAKYISEKNLGLIAELNFTQRGWKEEFDASPGFSYNRTLNYIELPFMTHVYFGRKMRFIVNAGPQISFLLGDKQNMSQALADDVAARQAADPDGRIGYQYSPMSTMSRVDYGLIGGIGIALKTDIGDFDLEGRYYFGLGDIFYQSPQR
jgi:hypothetical protein